MSDAGNMSGMSDKKSQGDAASASAVAVADAAAVGSPLDAAERVIVALDCSEDEARQLARRLAGVARWLKVGMTLYCAVGPRIVAELREQGFKVFVDLKLYDIPHQVRGGVASLVRLGADMLTVHGSGGLAMLQAAAEGVEQVGDRLYVPLSPVGDGVLDVPSCHGPATSVGDGVLDVPSLSPCPPAKPLVLAVTVLTSMDAATLAQVGVARPLNEQVERLALLAREAGLSGVVASPWEARALRALLGPDAAIVTPGVRPAGSAADDQSRVATPAEALANGASHLVVGRPITAAPDPAAAFAEIAASLPPSGERRLRS
jgi:orotidine-5'-phosphate decarboxylase